MTYTAVNAHPDRPRSGAAWSSYARARADVRADARAVPDPERRAAPARLDRLRPATRPRSSSTTGGVVEAIVALERNVAHRLIEEFMLLANETVAAHLEAHGVPALYRVHEEPDPLKVGEVRGVHLRLRLQPRRAADGAAAAALPEAGRADPRQARGEADRVPDAADDAEGALRAGEPRALRPGGAELHALHVADPPLSGPRRAPRAARGAARRC